MTGLPDPRVFQEKTDGYREGREIPLFAKTIQIFFGSGSQWSFPSKGGYERPEREGQAVFRPGRGKWIRRAEQESQAISPGS